MSKISGEQLGKLVNWLSELSGHGIYDSASLKHDFIMTVGRAPDWPEHTWLETKQIMIERGLGGELSPPHDRKLAYGYEIAHALSWEYAAFVSLKTGRGSSFWDHINALKNARDIKVMI
jgi:hypothetical protein